MIKDFSSLTSAHRPTIMSIFQETFPSDFTMQRDLWSDRLYVSSQFDGVYAHNLWSEPKNYNSCDGLS